MQSNEPHVTSITPYENFLVFTFCQLFRISGSSRQNSSVIQAIWIDPIDQSSYTYLHTIVQQCMKINISESDAASE